MLQLLLFENSIVVRVFVKLLSSVFPDRSRTGYRIKFGVHLFLIIFSEKKEQGSFEPEFFSLIERSSIV